MLDYIPCYKDFKIIVERITIKIKLKPNYYTYKKSVLNIEVWNKMYADFLLFHQNF